MFLLVWLHCLLAIFGMRRLGSALGAGRWQSYFMGFSFLASGALTARWMTGQISLLLGALLCAVAVLLRPAHGGAVAGPAARAIRGCCWPCSSCAATRRCSGSRRSARRCSSSARALRLPLREALRDAGRGLGQFGVACVWCAGLVAVVLLPMLELVRQGKPGRRFTPRLRIAYKLDWADLRYLFSPLQRR